MIAIADKEKGQLWYATAHVSQSHLSSTIIVCRADGIFACRELHTATGKPASLLPSQQVSVATSYPFFFSSRDTRAAKSRHLKVLDMRRNPQPQIIGRDYSGHRIFHGGIVSRVAFSDPAAQVQGVKATDLLGLDRSKVFRKP